MTVLSSNVCRFFLDPQVWIPAFAGMTMGSMANVSRMTMDSPSTPSRVRHFY